MKEVEIDGILIESIIQMKAEIREALAEKNSEKVKEDGTEEGVKKVVLTEAALDHAL